MEASRHDDAVNLQPLIDDIARYDLGMHIVEMEAFGVTVVPPEKLGCAPDFIERLKGAILRTCEKRNDVVLGDPDTAEAPNPSKVGRGFDLLEEDDVFAEAAINPVSLTLVRWLTGQSAIFGGHTWIVKGEGGKGPDLHVDASGVPPGGGHIAHMCNASWLCTDYAGAEDGPTIYVPGSHKYAHLPYTHIDTRVETTSLKWRPLIGKAGSLAVWHGAIWHGGAPRTKKGLRVTLVQSYYRPYMRTFLDYHGRVSPRLLEKYPELERVIGQPAFPFTDPHQAPGREVTARLAHAALHPQA